MKPAVRTQIAASDPAASVFVTANAGSGKTSTLVSRVARLLLGGSPPEAILCVTYTKAAAAEMQRRLFQVLGGWAVAKDEILAAELAGLDESARDLPRARRLFARALETPGGLKIQTIHAFCEKLLRRFPLEAGVSPGFQVLEDAAAAEVSAYARDAVAEAALEAPDGPIAAAYAHFSVELDWRAFNAMFADFAARRGAILAYVDACDATGGVAQDLWRRCGFDGPADADDLEAEAVAGVDWPAWRSAAAALAASPASTDQALAAAMANVTDGHGFARVWAIFCTQAGQPRARLGTNALHGDIRAWLAAEQTRLGAACERAKAARIARDTRYAITLALTYAELYEGAKTAAGALDFGDLIARTRTLLRERADAAWVLYKLDGGVDHILLDEAQDTAPDQWEILHALTDEFFAGAGREGRTARSVFAVGDEKQSIYSFQGARPERFRTEADLYRAQVQGAGGAFLGVPLEDSWRSTPEVLGFVDAVFADPDVAAGLTPGRDAGPLHHRPLREAGFGGVEFWPLMESEPDEDVDPWAPVDRESKDSANKKLARRIARAIREMIEARTAVDDKGARPPRSRAVTAGDFLILVRRRGALFHEIIRALKREGVASGGADRLRLSEHIVFQDLVALGRFVRFADDDLTLAALLRSPVCDIDEESLFALAYGRGSSSLWAVLNTRAGERPEWAAARDILAWCAAEAARRPPFDFYSRVLTRLDAGGRSLRSRLLTRFGREAEDAIEAFLGEALGLEQRRVHDLERFLDEMVRTDLEVKREAEDLGGEVRVMTVHGAKGLEAPIVILPDTTTRARAQGGPLLGAEDGGFLWAPRRADDCPASAAARAARELAADQESLRLFYVALTRARDRLIIAGVKTTDRFYGGSWRALASAGLQRPEIAAATRLIEGDDGGPTRFGADPVRGDPTEAQSAADPPLPDWARRFPTPEPRLARYASPSTFAEAEKGPAPSPLAEQDGLGRFRRGLLIHRLLQVLPDLAVSAREAAAARLLDREPGLTDSQRQEMAAAALGVLNDQRFAAVFGPGSRAEASIAGGAPGLPTGLAVSGRLDRLVVEPERVLVVDFKTNRPAPDRVEDADPAYLTQMAIYVAVLEAVFPGRAVEAALVWTDGPKLMPIPEKIVRETLAAIRTDG